MKLFLISAGFAAVLTTAVMSQVVRATDAAPCEKGLAALRAAEQDKQPLVADLATFKRLKKEGIERCKEDDDAGADALFKQALALLRE